MRRFVLPFVVALSTMSMFGASAQQPQPFSDVPKDHWAFQAVENLRQKGILRGYPDGNYRGKRTVTRYELSTALSSFLQSASQRATGAPGQPGPQGKPGEKGEPGPKGAPGPKGVKPPEVTALEQFIQGSRPEVDRLHENLKTLQNRLDGLDRDKQTLRDTKPKDSTVKHKSTDGW